MRGLAIRPSTEADVEALVELDIASAAYHASLDPDAYRIPEREAAGRFLRRRLDAPGRRVLVAEVDGRVVGMVDVAMAEPPDPGSIVRPVPTADIVISVARGWRGRGVGHALMQAAEADARARGAERIVLDMAAANKGALRFYERLGYRVHGLFLERDLA